MAAAVQHQKLATACPQTHSGEVKEADVLVVEYHAGRKTNPGHCAVSVCVLLRSRLLLRSMTQAGPGARLMTGRSFAVRTKPRPGKGPALSHWSGLFVCVWDTISGHAASPANEPMLVCIVIWHNTAMKSSIPAQWRHNIHEARRRAMLVSVLMYPLFYLKRDGSSLTAYLKIAASIDFALSIAC